MMMVVIMIKMKEIDEGASEDDDNGDDDDDHDHEDGNDSQVAPVISSSAFFVVLINFSVFVSLSIDSLISALSFAFKALVLAKLPDFLFSPFLPSLSFVLTSSSFFRFSCFASIWSLWLFVSRSWDIPPAGRT